MRLWGGDTGCDGAAMGAAWSDRCQCMQCQSHAGHGVHSIPLPYRHSVIAASIPLAAAGIRVAHVLFPYASLSHPPSLTLLPSPSFPQPSFPRPSAPPPPFR